MPIRNDRPGSPAAPKTTPAAPAKTNAPVAPAAPVAKPAAPRLPAGLDGASGMDPARKPAVALGGVEPAAVTTPPSGSLAAAFDAIPTVGGGPADSQILSKNLDAWNARWDMLTSARSTIDSTYFIMEKDPFGYAFLGALLKKQLEGVKVRVMTDAMADTFGTHGFKAPLRGQDYLQELVDHGAEAYIYHPITSRLGEVLQGGYAMLASNHDKILVVDGQQSVTGGRNVAADYFADPADRQGAWRDMDVAMKGAGPARGLTAAFEAELHNGDAAKPVHKDLLGNWSKKDLQLVGAYELMDLWLKDPPLSDADKTRLRGDEAGRQQLADDLVQRALARLPGDLPEGLRREPSKSDREFLAAQARELVTNLEARGSQASYHAQGLPVRPTEAKIIDQTSAAGTRVNGMAPAFAELVDSAKSRIDIENPYVVLTEDMMHTLERASARGVEINIVTNSPLSTDSDVTQAFFLEDWKDILARCPTAHIYVATGHQKFHAKSAVIDGEDCVVSTYNMDLLSGYVNSEVGAVVKSKELASDLLGAFAADRARASNGFLEYTIQKDASGKPVLQDGKPIPVFGPENHLPPEVLAAYAKKRQLWGHTVRDNLDLFKPLRHPDRIDS